jgi:thiol:disulfide interchange protein
MQRAVRLSMLTVVLAVVIFGCGGQGPEAPVAGVAAVSSHGAVALTRARAENKPVMVTFYADWCIWCKRFEDTTLADGAVATYLSEKVVSLRLDVDGDGQELSDRYRVDGLPTILVLDPDGEELGRIPGYLPPAGFLDRVRAMLG